MGILSKAWKGLKKGVKKIGKGIKKVFGKVAKVFGKLGIVGQLALGFLMPYALGAMSSFASAALGKVSTWSTTLLKSSNVFVNAVGKGLKLVHDAGTALGRMYTSVTDTISAGVDKTKELLGLGPTESVDLTKATTDIDSSTIFKEGTLELKESTLGDKLMANVDPTTVTAGPQAPFTGDIDILGSTISGNPADLRTAMGTKGADILTTDVTKSILAPTDFSDITDSTLKFGSSTNIPASTNIVQDISTGVKKFAGDINITNPESQIRQDIADFSAYDYGKSAVKGTVDSAVMGGMQDAGRQKVACALGYKIPNSNQTYINLPEMQGSRTDIGKYNEASIWAQSNGNNFITQSFRPRDYVAEAFGTSNEVQDYFNAIKPIQPIGVA